MQSVVASKRIFYSYFFEIKYNGNDSSHLCDTIVHETSYNKFKRKTFKWTKIMIDNDTSLRALLHTHDYITIRTLKQKVFPDYSSLNISYIRNKEEFKDHRWYEEDGGYTFGLCKPIIKTCAEDKSGYIRQIRNLIDEYGVAKATIKIFKEHEALVPYLNQVNEMYSTVSSLEYMCEQQNDAIAWLNKNKCYLWQQNLLEILKLNPDDRKIIYIYDKYGNTGKTTFKDKYFFAHFEDTVCLMSFKTADMLHVVSKAIMPRVIFVDVQRTALNEGSDKIENISWGTIENLKNGNFMSPKYNSQYLVRKRPHIVIFANFLPEVNVWSLDRWVLGEINNRDYTMKWRVIPPLKYNRCNCDIEDFEDIDIAELLAQIKSELK